MKFSFTAVFGLAVVIHWHLDIVVSFRCCGFENRFTQVTDDLCLGIFGPEVQNIPELRTCTNNSIGIFAPNISDLRRNGLDWKIFEAFGCQPISAVLGIQAIPSGLGWSYIRYQGRRYEESEELPAVPFTWSVITLEFNASGDWYVNYVPYDEALTKQAFCSYPVFTVDDL